MSLQVSLPSINTLCNGLNNLLFCIVPIEGGNASLAKEMEEPSRNNSGEEDKEQQGEMFFLLCFFFLFVGGL